MTTLDSVLEPTLTQTLDIVREPEVVILYHANCLDGFASAYAAWLVYNDKASYIPVKYGEEPPDVVGKEVYIVDFSYPLVTLEAMEKEATKVQILDHHITAKETLSTLPYAYFDMGKCGAVLTWEYFHPDKPLPWLFTYIQDNDLGKWKSAYTLPIVTALFESVHWDFKEWDTLIKGGDQDKLISIGHILLTSKEKRLLKLLSKAHPINIDGELGYACNASPEYATELGKRLMSKFNTFGAIYHYDGKVSKWHYSLRCGTNYNVATLCKAFGGGGHNQAAGFSISTLPNPKIVSSTETITKVNN